MLGTLNPSRQTWNAGSALTVLQQFCLRHANSRRQSALLTLSSGGFQIKLSARDDTLASIAQLPLTEVTDLSLLTAPAFNLVYNNNIAIVEISR